MDPCLLLITARMLDNGDSSTSVGIPYLPATYAATGAPIDRPYTTISLGSCVCISSASIMDASLYICLSLGTPLLFP